MKPEGNCASEPATAAARIDKMMHESRLGQAYYDGHQDGALSVLAPALGVEPQNGELHQLMGLRFRVTVEWVDPIDDGHLSVARKMVERARQRAQERL